MINGNPFYIQPGGDFGPGLMGLSQTIERVGELKKSEQEKQDEKTRIETMKKGALEAVKSGDPNKIREFMVSNPEMALTIKKTMEMKLPGDSINVYKNTLFSTALDPSTAKQGLEDMRSQFAKDGIDAKEQETLDKLQSIIDQKTPEEIQKGAESALALIADEDTWKKYKDIAKTDPNKGLDTGYKTYLSANNLTNSPENYKNYISSKEYAPTEIKKLIDERQTLIDSGVPNDDPRIVAYDHKLAGSTIDPEMVDALAQQVIEGRLDPNTISKRQGLQQSVYTRIESMAPGANLTELSANAKFKALPANLTSRALINGVAPLYESLLVAGKALSNSRFQLYNKAVNYYKEQTGDPGIVAFNNLRDDMIAETERILMGSGVLSDSKYMRALKNVNSAQSYEQLKAAVDQLQFVVKSRLEALNKSPFKNANPNMPEKELHFDSQGNLIP